ncbi:MAG: exosortase/archaeosortase family protein [Isosphaeraceae bacterium]
MHRLLTSEPRLLALAVGVGILTWAYWPNLEVLYATWSTEPNYSHGKLVVPIAIAIFWQRLLDSKAGWRGGSVPWWSFVVLLLVLAARAFAYEQNTQWLETATLVPAVAALMFTIGGWPLLERGWPAAVFLFFMLPLPRAANNLISLPLQTIATLGSVFAMQLTGLRTYNEGNVITLPDNPVDARTLEVALACNGLSMLMTLAATVTATIMLIPMANWKRIIIFLSAVPIALLSNIIRIVATGWCYSIVRSEHAKQLAHDYSGYLMMPLALVLVGLEVLILSWLAGPEKNPESDRIVLAVIPQAGGGKGATKMLADEL